VNKIAVLDRERHVLSTAWPVDAEGNTPIALDQGNHRLFSACYRPPSIVGFDTATGTPVTAVEIDGGAHDMFL
jgi:hypothetical protein